MITIQERIKRRHPLNATATGNGDSPERQQNRKLYAIVQLSRIYLEREPKINPDADPKQDLLDLVEFVTKES